MGQWAGPVGDVCQRMLLISLCYCGLFFQKRFAFAVRIIYIGNIIIYLIHDN